MPANDDPTASYPTFEEFLQSGACRNKHEAEAIWAYWRSPRVWGQSVENEGQMADTKRFLPDGSGFTFEEIADFPDYCIRPEKNNKNKILSGYFDLLYYEFREQAALGHSVMSSMIVLVAVLFVVFHEHVLATAIVLSLIGVASAIGGARDSKRFSSYRNAVERELRRLGVGIRHEQLHKQISFSTEWGKVHRYPVSGLGIVRPVNTENHVVSGDRVFALADDSVYR